LVRSALEIDGGPAQAVGFEEGPAHRPRSGRLVAEMRILDIRERTVPISRYSDPATRSGGLTTSIVAVVTDVVRDGRPVVGYGFSSIGRLGQDGLIRERFAPRLMAASEADLADAEGSNLDPFCAWSTMMARGKPGGHGERCVAVGTLDMAIWDAAAKIANQPLCRFLAHLTGVVDPADGAVVVYASGGYPHPENDLTKLGDEIRRLLSIGYTRVKIKVGAAPLAGDRRRIETALALLPGSDRLAVDAMNAYDGSDSPGRAAGALCTVVARGARHAGGRGRGLRRCDRDRRGPVLGSGGEAPRAARRASPRPRWPAVRPRPLLRPSRLPAHPGIPRGAGMAALAQRQHGRRGWRRSG
jgi:hypothetical protein